MAEKFPPQTWPEGAEPTTAQLKKWIRAFDPDEHDVRVAADMLVFMLDQEQRAHAQTRYTLGLREGALRRYQGKAKRYRSAWLSARRRGVWRIHRTLGLAPQEPSTPASGV